MQRKTETLEVGTTAPGFALSAANRDGQFALDNLVAHGPVVLEFLRGTW